MKHFPSLTNHPWFRQRGYRHFDAPVGLGIVEKYVTSSECVSKHSFFPFIKFVMDTPRFSKAEKKVVSKERDVCYASHRDAYIFSYYNWLLNNFYERYLADSRFASSVLAYRKLGKSNVNFAVEAFEEIVSRENCSALCYDISKFFDTLDHAILKKNIELILGVKQLSLDWYAVFKAVTKFSFVMLDEIENLFVVKGGEYKASQPYCNPVDFRNKVRAARLVKTNQNKFGIPQGSPISATLSNIYMIDFDKEVFEFCNGLGASYRRYSDDILVICDHSDVADIDKFIRTAIAEMHLAINEKKFENVQFPLDGGCAKNKNFVQYLGFTFDGKKILIRSSSLARIGRKLSRAVRKRKWLAKKAFNKALAKGKKTPPTSRLYTRKLFEDYSHLSKGQSFHGYARRSMTITKSSSIMKQLKRLWPKLLREIKS